MDIRTDADKYLQDMQFETEEKNFGKVAVSSSRAIKLNKDNWIYVFGLAEAHTEQTKYKQACSLYKHALILNSDNALLCYNFGYTLQILGRVDESIEMYRKTIELDPNDADGYYNLGMMLTMKENYQEAEEKFMEVLKLQPSLSPEVYNCLGFSYFLQGKFENAILAFQESVELNEKYILAYCNLSLVHFCDNKSEEAEKFFEKGMKTLEDPQDKAMEVTRLIVKYQDDKVRLEMRLNGNKAVSEEKTTLLKTLISGFANILNLLKQQSKNDL